MNKKIGFFAYGANYPHTGEFIENAIRKINEKSEEIEIASWKKLKISGVFIISEVLKKINEADFLCADITGMNDNVLFEIGFAISKKKPIWLVHDTTVIGSVQKYKELNFITSIGYCSFTNSDDIVKGFFDEYDAIFSKDLFSSLFSFIEPKKQDSILLYLKSQISTDHNKYIVNLLNSLGFTYTVDDPNESRVQPLTWYLQQITSTPAVLIEFSATNRSGFELQNSKCAFLAGISYGLELKTLIIAAEPYDTPLDYKELLHKFWNLQSLKKPVDEFIYSVRDNLPKLLAIHKRVSTATKSISKLQKLTFGEFIAEHESDHIYDYYIETAHQQNLLKNEYNIVVGRKGTGKTATLYYLNEKFSKNVRNHICLIKPVNFELDGLISIFTNLKDDFEKGFITETIWKFLIYTEIAKTVYERIKDKPVYALEDSENDLIKFIDHHQEIFLSDFSTRLDEQLNKLNESQLGANFRNKLSEVFHQEVISKVKNLIINTFTKKERLIVLIDNLDKSWRKNSNIELVSKFILGLLGVVGRIAKEFRLSNKNPHIKFQFNLTLFLRSDIFKYIQQYAREPDKLEFTKLLWNDEEIFIRMINERINTLNNQEKIDAHTFWEKLIVNSVNDVPVRKFIHANVIPRPRDIIFYFSTAKNIATARGHSMIEEADLVQAHIEYSNWVFKSIIVENGITMYQMEDFLFNLMGENQILNKDEIINFMTSAKISNAGSLFDYFVDKLVSLTLLGRETKTGYFDYVYDFESDEKSKVMAGKLGSNRFKIHNAFAAFLECKNLEQIE